MNINTDINISPILNKNSKKNIVKTSLSNDHIIQNVDEDAKNHAKKMGRSDCIKKELSKGVVHRLSFEIKNTNKNHTTNSSFEKLPKEITETFNEVILDLATRLVKTPYGMKPAFPNETLNQLSEEISLSFYNKLQEYKLNNGIDHLLREDYLKIFDQLEKQMNRYIIENKLNVKETQFYSKKRAFDCTEFKLSFFKEFINLARQELL